LIDFYRAIDLHYYANPVIDLARLGGREFAEPQYPASTVRTRARYFSSLSYDGTFNHSELGQYSAVPGVNLTNLQACIATDEILFSEATDGPRDLPPSVDLPPAFTEATHREAFSYKIVIDTLNRSFLRPFIKQVHETADGVKILRLELFLSGDAINVWVWEKAQTDHPRYYHNAAGLLCLYIEDPEWQDSLELIQGRKLPPNGLIKLITLPTTINAARDFWFPNRIELAPIQALTWANVEIEFFKLVKSIHQRATKDERLRYHVEDDFKGPAAIERHVIVLSCAGCRCPIETQFLAHLKRFRDKPELLKQSHLLIRAPASVNALRAFIGRLVAEPHEVTPDMIDELILIAEELGDEELLSIYRPSDA
jgi:hypothetical protein